MPADKPLRFTDRWQKKLARAAADVGWKRLAEIATVARAGTIRQWHQLMLNGKPGIQNAGTGKPPTSDAYTIANDHSTESFGCGTYFQSAEPSVKPEHLGYR